MSWDCLKVKVIDPEQVIQPATIVPYWGRLLGGGVVMEIIGLNFMLQ